MCGTGRSLPLLLLLVVLSPLLLVHDARAQGRAEAVLTLQPEGETATLNFGEERGTRRERVLLLSSSPLAQAPRVIASDLKTSADSLFPGRLAAQAKLADPRTVVVAISVAPGDAEAGDYSGRLLLHGPGIANTSIPLTVKLTATGWSRFWSWLVAIVALGGGLFVGMAMKWLSDTGTKLQDLAARLDVMQRAVEGLRAVPAQALVQIRAVREHIANGNAAKAETAFKPLEEHSSELVRVSWLLGSLGAELRRQEQLLGTVSGGWAQRRDELSGVIHAEQRRVEEQREGAWPDPAAGSAARTELARQVQGFSGFLARLSNPAFAAKAELDAVVSHYLAGEFEQAKKEWKALSGAAEAAPGESVKAMQVLAEGAPLADYLSEPPPEVVAGPEAGLMERRGNWAVEHADLLLRAGLGVGLLVVGLATVFHPDAMFHGAQGADILALFSWGLASGITSGTITDLAGKLSPKSG